MTWAATRGAAEAGTVLRMRGELRGRDPLGEPDDLPAGRERDDCADGPAFVRLRDGSVIIASTRLVPPLPVAASSRGA